MQPYQEASEEIQRQGQFPKRLLETAGSIASTAITGYGAGVALNKVLPFLNKYIPKDLAIKGLSKIDPRFGKFINTALGNGESFEGIKDFIKQKMDSTSEEKPKSKGVIHDDLIEMYSPDLSKMIEEMIDSGETAETAAAVVKSSPKQFSKYKDSIKQIEEHAGQDFSSIVKHIYDKFTKGRKKNNQEKKTLQSGAQQRSSGSNIMDLISGMRSSMQKLQGV